VNNYLIKNLSWNGIQAIFNDFSDDIYAPLTYLINAVLYKIGGLNPVMFHFTSLAFHLLNTALVFWFITLLCSRLDIAAITALFFGIHPIQVESIAWASAATNVHCAAFFLGSLIAYLYYLRKSQKRYLIISLFFFGLSVLSKAVAVVLPVILLLIDYYKGRKITAHILLEKVPFLLLSFGAGVLSFLLKNQSGAVGDFVVLPFTYRIMFASYGFITYLFKLLFPVNLSAFYPYPSNNGEVYIPAHYYAYLLSLIGLGVYIIYRQSFSKRIIFGVGFFIITIFLVLQLLPVGRTIMADRYSYIPSIGIFYMAGEGLMFLWSKKMKLFSIILISAFTVFFSAQTFSRCRVWKNDMTLWNDVIVYNNAVAEAYLHRGVVFVNQKRYSDALSDFNRAIELNKGIADTYNSRGSLFIIEKRNDEALKDFNKAIELQPIFAEAYTNRGYLYLNEKRIDEALKDFNKAIELKPDYALTYNNRGNLFVSEKRNDEAIKDFNKAIELNTNFAEAYSSRGILFVNNKRFSEALNDFNKAIQLKSDYAEAYFNRGTLYFIERRNDEALSDFIKAVELNQNYAEAYTNMGNLFFAEKRFEEAINTYSKAIALKTEYAQAYFNRGLAEYYSGKKEAACSDLQKAVDLGFKPATEALIHICR
jgi:protein O-mannosyl-transferase